MKYTNEEEYFDGIEEDMYFPNITQSNTNNFSFYPDYSKKTCAYSDKKGKCILGDEYTKCKHKKNDNSCGYTIEKERIPFIDCEKIKDFENIKKLKRGWKL